VGHAAPLGRRSLGGAERAGYTIGSAYTAVKDPSRTKFTYRDRLWEGADLAALGVASFGHIHGVHMQNVDTWEAYAAAIERGDSAAWPRVPPDAGRAPDPRDDPATQARRHSPELFRRQVRRRYPRALRRRVASNRRRRFLAPARRPHRADARRPAARRHAAPALLPAATIAHGVAAYT
jgi:hypothetical protein